MLSEMHTLFYGENTGIPFHCDNEECYGSEVFGWNVTTQRVLLMRRGQEDWIRVLLNPGNMYYLTGQARYEYEHGFCVPFDSMNVDKMLELDPYYPETDVEYCTETEFMGEMIPNLPSISATLRHRYPEPSRLTSEAHDIAT